MIDSSHCCCFWVGCARGITSYTASDCLLRGLCLYFIEHWRYISNIGKIVLGQRFNNVRLDWLDLFHSDRFFAGMSICFTRFICLCCGCSSNWFSRCANAHVSYMCACVCVCRCEFAQHMANFLFQYAYFHVVKSQWTFKSAYNVSEKGKYRSNRFPWC